MPYWRQSIVSWIILYWPQLFYVAATAGRIYNPAYKGHGWSYYLMAGAGWRKFVAYPTNPCGNRIQALYTHGLGAGAYGSQLVTLSTYIAFHLSRLPMGALDSQN